MFSPNHHHTGLPTDTVGDIDFVLCIIFVQKVTFTSLSQHILCALFFWNNHHDLNPKQHLKNWNYKMFHSSLDTSRIQLTELTVRQSLFYNNQFKPKQTRLKPQSTNHHMISQINCLGFQSWSLISKIPTERSFKERFRLLIHHLKWILQFVPKSCYISKDKFHIKPHKEIFWSHSEAWKIQVAKSWTKALRELLPMDTFKLPATRMENWSQLLL